MYTYIVVPFFLTVVYNTDTISSVAPAGDVDMLEADK